MSLNKAITYFDNKNIEVSPPLKRKNLKYRYR